MGKTSVIRKMCSESKRGFLKYRDLEGIHTPLEFAELVLSDAREAFTQGQKVSTFFKSLIKDLGGVEVGGLIKFPDGKPPSWKQVLQETLQAMVRAQESKLVIFFWDELPLMLHNIVKREGEEIGMSLLDLLRGLRQELPTLRMVYTGSIGLHNVLRSLKRQGYANAPVNDMYMFPLPHFSQEHAQELASKLLQAEKLPHHLELQHALALAADHIPYYIHHLVDQLRLQRDPITPELVQKRVTALIRSPQDPWQLKHYVERIGTYYTETEQQQIFVILDRLCVTSKGMTTSQLRKHLDKSRWPSSPAGLAELLQQLELDHYLRPVDEAYELNNTILKQGWRYHRGL
ncbi:MAG: ATP-binding protein [Myxococcota bacterium]